MDKQNNNLSYCNYVNCRNSKCLFYGTIGDKNICLSSLKKFNFSDLISKYEQWVKDKKELIKGKCSKCGANIEVTEYDNGEVLIRRDCLCNKKDR